MEVSIHIRACHTSLDPALGQDADEVNDLIEQWHEGRIRREGGILTIDYKEKEPDFPEIMTHISLRDGHLSVTKEGGISSRQEFAQGLTFQDAYETPYGVLEMAVTTRTMDTNFTSLDDGYIQVDYDIFLSGEKVGSCQLDIRVRPKAAKRISDSH